MMKCWVSNRCQAASAGAAIASAAAPAREANKKRIGPPNSAPHKLSSINDRASVASEETVGVHVDADADLGAPVECGEPVADDVLDVEAAAGVDEDALAVAAAKHGQRGGG